MKTNKAVAYLLFFILMASCTKEIVKPDPEEPSPVPQLIYSAPANKDTQIIAYFPYYQEVNSESIPDSKLKMIDVACFAFAQLNSNFTVTVPNQEKLKILSDRCKALGVKVVISFNGKHSDYLTMVSNAENRNIFINSLKNIVDTYSLDGIDNDWEYPSAKDGSDIGNLYLMRELSNYCHDPKVNKLLTMAITCGKYVGNYTNGIKNELYECVDWFNVMTYDDFSTTVSGIHHSPLSLVEIAYEYWVKKRQLPISKFITGIPIYGRPSGISQSGNVLTYKNIIKQGGSPDENSAQVFSSNYLNGTTPYTIYYNGRPLVREKCRYTLDHNLGGIMFWEAGQDTQDETSIIATAYKEMNS